MKSISIRAVLLAGTVAVLVPVLGAVAWLGYEAGQDEATELFDARLATSARVLAALVQTQAEAARAGPTVVVTFPAPLETAVHDEPTALGHHYETKVAFQVHDANGRLLLRSAAAPDTPYAALAAGFATTQGIAEHAWRVFTLRSGELWIQAAERDDVRIELAEKLALATVAPVIVGIPVVLLLLSLLVRYALRPLAELARRIERRQPDSLAPIGLTRNPAETTPVLAALNGLLARVQAAFDRERRFTADAAHELRTPLTGLKVHAQNAARAGSEEERQASLRLMLEGLERSIRLAEQMLAYSRVAAAPAPPADSVSLREVVEEALEDVLPLVRQRGQRVELASDPPVSELPVRGERDKLTVLARNVLDNASRYAPAGSTLRIELQRDASHTTFSVVDPGSGIPRELRERVFESYYRIPGSRGEGSGLGLAIVREIAAQHGASVEIGEGDGGRGTRVRVRFRSLPETRG